MSRFLMKMSFFDYLNGEGSWTFPGESPKPIINDLLGAVVSNILEIVFTPQEVVQEAAIIPNVPLKVCLIGKAFSGKSTLAKSIARTFSLTIIDPEVLVKDFMSQQKEAVSGKNRTSAVLQNSAAKSQLLDGASLDDEVIVNLVVSKIKSISTDSQSTGGWIALDFPRNRQQAQLFEKEISGYEDPKPIKPGNIKRTPKDKDKTPRRSLIAPSDLKTDTKTPVAVSGVDIVVLLDIDNEVAVKRASGRRVDPITGISYHLEYNPPPENVVGLFERLVPVEDEGNQSTQLQYQLAAFEEQEELLKEWFGRFGNMQILDASSTAAASLSAMTELILASAKKKEKEMEEKTSEERAPGDDSAVLGTVQTLKDAADVGGDKKNVLNKQTEEDKKKAPGSAKARTLSGKVQAEKAAPAPKSSVIDVAKPTSTDTAKAPQKIDPNVKKSPNTAGSQPVEVAAVEITEPLMMRSSMGESKKQPSKELAEILSNQWTTIEKSYTETIKFAFRCLRHERELMLRYFHDTKVNFRKCLERPDKKQEILELFQTEFNAIEDDLRSDPDAKAELHQRAEDLLEKLWDMSDMRREEAEAERVAVIDDKWIEDHYAIITNIHITMVQAELDRYIMSRNVINDYYRDAYGTSPVISDSFKIPPKIALLNNNSISPFDISTCVVNSSETHRKRDISSAGAVASKGSRNTKKRELSAQSKPQNSSAAAQSATQAGVNNEVNSEIDNILLVDLEAAIAAALATKVVPVEDVVIQEKDKKDKKKGTGADILDVKVAEPEVEVPSESTKILEIEDSVFQQRLERLKKHALNTLKELKSKGIDVYNLLDEWIGIRFQNECEAIVEMMNLIKEAIEVEVKLPNELVLEGEKFKIDFTILTYEPELEMRPESPIEKQNPDQFTVLQLVNISRHFRELAPSGIMSTKEFIDNFHKLMALSTGMEILTENYMNTVKTYFAKSGADSGPENYTTDISMLQQIASLLDPLSTGYINWRRFIVLNARILPIPNVEQMQFLKFSLAQCASYVDGTISKADFLRVPLWFEDEAEDSNGFDGSFNRPAKLKAALAYIFSVADSKSSGSDGLSLQRANASLSNLADKGDYTESTKVSMGSADPEGFDDFRIKL